MIIYIHDGKKTTAVKAKEEKGTPTMDVTKKQFIRKKSKEEAEAYIKEHGGELKEYETSGGKKAYAVIKK